MKCGNSFSFGVGAVALVTGHWSLVTGHCGQPWLILLLLLLVVVVVTSVSCPSVSSFQ